MQVDGQQFILEFGQIEGDQTAVVGGKGTQLAALTRLSGVTVPPGFCVTTAAYRTAVAADPEIDALAAEVAAADLRDGVVLARRSEAVRDAVEALAMPDQVAGRIRAALAKLGGPDAAYAVRSSATAEDSAEASFAGQHDSFLNVVGADAVIEHVRRCWASLFTEQAMAYRSRSGTDPGAVEMAVVVQQMAEADAAGVLFTADPTNGNRTVTAIEAVRGLGEALVSGKATPDRYGVRAGEIVDRALAGDEPVLSDEQVLRIASLGRAIEAALGSPQDVESRLAMRSRWSRAARSPRSTRSRRSGTTTPTCTCRSGTSR